MASTSGFRALSIICLALCFSWASSVHNDLHEAKFYKLEGKSLFGNLTERHLTQDFLDCSFLCVKSATKNCFPFNFGGAERQGLYECELSNSEKKFNPKNLQERQGFSYYGMKEENFKRQIIRSLFKFFPCLSSPCRNGGSCVTGRTLGMFTCNCPLEVRTLPYVDRQCNVDFSLIKRTDPVQGVFAVSTSRYQLNYFEAERICGLIGANLASFDQLTTAWKAGLEHCKMGWLFPGKVGYPMHRAVQGCGYKAGIIGGRRLIDKERKYNAWCYKKVIV